MEREKATDAEINKLKSVYGEKEEVVQETSGHLAAQGVYFRYYICFIDFNIYYLYKLNKLPICCKTFVCKLIFFLSN